MESVNKPIGYLVKQVDVLLTNGINKIQEAFGLTRTGWQLIHTISETGGTDVETLGTLMLPFANAGQTQILIHQLVVENVICLKSENKYSLTEKGIQLHHQCLAEQNVFRQKVMVNITTDEYVNTLQTLQKIITNLSSSTEDDDIHLYN